MQEADSKIDVLQETFFDIISKGDYDLINDFLLNNPFVDLKYLDENMQNGLFYAVCSIEPDKECLLILELLIGKGMNPSVIDKFNQTLLFYSCSAGLVSTTEWLITKFKLDVNHSDVKGQTPLFYAAKENRKEIIQLLIDKGANIKHLDNEGLNCIYMIENNDHAGLVSYLIYQGIDPNVIGKNGQQYIQKMEKMGFFKILDALNGKCDDIHDSKRKKYVLAHKKHKAKPLTEIEIDQFKSDHPDIFRLLEDNTYLRDKMKQNDMKDNSSSEIIDINHS